MNTDPILLPTFANLTSKRDRAVRSLCCNLRVQVAYRSMNTTVGEQLVYQCNGCTKLYVVRECDEKVTEANV